MKNMIQLPCIVSVKFGLKGRLDTLVNEEKRMILHIGQLISYNGIFHKESLGSAQKQIYDKYMKLYHK